MKFNIILSNLTILYLEDDDIIRHNVKEMLQLLCKKVIAVSNISDANHFLNSDDRIDIFISDININDENSLDLIESFRQTNKKLPIIVMSAYTDKSYLLQAAKLKLSDYLVKPATFEEILNALRKAVSDIQDNNGFKIQLNESIVFNTIDNQLYNETLNEIIHLTSKELKLLQFFLTNHKKILSQEEIKISIWNYDEEPTDSAFKNLINKLRKKVGKETIINIAKVGYKLNIS